MADPGEASFRRKPRTRQRGTVAAGASIEALEQQLRRCGYELLRRRHEWCEVLVLRDRERWHGAGLTWEEALRDALARALPSHLGQHLLARAVSEATESTHGSPQPAAPPLSTPARAPARASPPAASSPAAAPKGAETRPAPEGRYLSEERVAQEFDDLEERIRASNDEVAAWTAPRQRLQLLEWIAWARSIEEAALEPRSASERGGALARRVSGLAARWWPGWVSALRIDSFPAGSSAQVGVDASRLKDWSDVAEAARNRLEQKSEKEEAQGADEDGWWDAGALHPMHPDPGSILGDARRVLEELTGPLGEKPQQPRSLPEGRKSELVLLAKKLRWIRGADVNRDTWGALMGRLRFLAGPVPSDGDPRGLGRWIDHRMRPVRTWAIEIGWDPERKERRRRRHQVLVAAPDGRTTPEDLQRWLVEALDCEDLELAKIAALVQNLAPLVRSIEEATFSAKRKHRRRLGKLKKLLEEPLPPREKVVRELGAEESVEPVTPSAAAADPLEEMRVRVLPLVRDRRVLLVSNRADPRQDDTLLETFEFSDLDHEVASPRRTEALVQRIVAGSYDLILSATGFQSHFVDARLREAAGKAGVPYVRANRARRAACIRALFRDLGRRAERVS